MGRLNKLKPFAKTYAVLIAAFFLSMTLVYCIPASWIRGNVEKSLEVMEAEGERPMYAFYRHSAFVDNHTDMVMYKSLIANREYYNPIQASVSINQYPRYWHGYQVVLRPLSMVFQVQELRYLGMLLFYLLFFWSAWLVAKKIKFLYAMLYVLTIASSYLVVVTTCFQYLTTFYVLFGALIWLLSRYEKDRPVNLMLYFFVVGMIENFFDFLTYPIITLGIPLIILLWLRVRDEQADFKSNFRFMFQSSVSWGLGYALTWIAKWGITVVVLGVRYFWRTMSVVQYRLAGSEEEPLDRFGTIRRNLKAWMNVQDGGVITWSKIALLVLVVVVILVLWKKLKDKKTVFACVPMLLVALYPYIWYLVMSNHSQIHFWYTYRAQLVTMFGGLVFIASILKTGQKEGTNTEYS